MGLADYISKGREGLNSVAKNIGNRLYDGLGDKLSGDINVKGLVKVGVVSVAISVGGLVEGCGNGNALDSAYRITQSKINSDKARNKAPDLGALEYVMDGFLYDLIPTYTRKQKIVFASLTDFNNDGKISYHEIQTSKWDKQTLDIDLSKSDLFVNSHVAEGGLVGFEGAYKITSPSGEEIFKIKTRKSVLYTTNHVKSNNNGGADKNNINGIVDSVYENPGNYKFRFSGCGGYVEWGVNLRISDMTKIKNRSGVGQVESIGSNKD